jgi:hypothetical protein
LAVTRLRSPDKALSTSPHLPVVSLPVAELVRISGHKAGEPYFGTSGGNRFDAPGCKTGTAEYASCYLGLTFEVALAESLLHDAVPVKGKFPVAKSEIDRRWVHRFSADLRLFDLSGPLLKTMGGHVGLTGTGNYAVSQKWALAVFRNPLQVDGFIYVSRHLPNGCAVVLFDRAKAKLQPIGNPVSLDKAPGMVAAMTAFSIDVA